MGRQEVKSDNQVLIDALLAIDTLGYSTLTVLARRIRDRLNARPDAMKIGVSMCPKEIIKAYTEGDINFYDAVERIEGLIVKAQYEERVKQCSEALSEVCNVSYGRPSIELTSRFKDETEEEYQARVKALRGLLDNSSRTRKEVPLSTENEAV